MAANYTFDGSDHVENNVAQVMNATVPRPSAAEVKQACLLGAVSADNTRIFSLSISKQSESTTGGFHSTIIDVLVAKHAQVDCITNQATTFVHFDVTGEIDGKDFLALSTSPPALDTTPGDSTATPPAPPLTTFNPDPRDTTLLGLALLPNGQMPSFDGLYAGRFSGAVTRPDGTAGGTGDEAMSFSVARTIVTVNTPGSGSGTIDQAGGVSLCRRGAWLLVRPVNTRGHSP